MTIADLQRNDLDGAERVASSLVREFGHLPAAIAHYLYLLQDDDSDLRRRLSGLQIADSADPVL